MDRVKDLKKKGHIRGYKEFSKQDKKYSNNQPKNIPERGSREKGWMGWNLAYWCNEQAVTLEPEYHFHPGRKWRFDWAIPSLKIAIEYEGLMSEKSRHTSVKGFTGDTEKYNAAQASGWKVLRFTALNYRNLFTELNKMNINAKR